MGRALPLIGRLALTASAAVCFAAASPLAQAHEHGKPLTKARFLHAVPMAAPATLIVHGHPPRIASSYGKPSEYHACHPGPARVELKLRGQRKPAATANLDIGRGRYTVIAVPDRGKLGLRVYKDGTATPGKARMRTINAAAELPAADMRVDGQQVHRIGSDHATGYASVPPGHRDLSITAPGREFDALMSAKRVSLAAGSASTAIVVGTRGAATRMLLVSDQTAGPSVAPATGFVDDIGSGSGWLLVLLAALAAGWLGGTTYLLSARRRTGATLPATGVMAAPQVPRARFRPPTDATPPATGVLEAPQVPRAHAPPTSAPPIRRQSRVEPAPDRSWALAAAAALTAGSVGRLLYKAGRRRRGA